MHTLTSRQRRLAGGLLLVAGTLLAAAPAAAGRPYRFAVEPQDAAKAVVDGPLPSFNAVAALEEDILQAVASYYRITLTLHCEDPRANTSRQAVDKRNATVAEMVNAVRGKPHTFVYRDGNDRVVEAPAEAAYPEAFALRGARDEKHIASIDAFPPGCATTGPAVRRFVGERRRPLPSTSEGQPPSVEEIAAIYRSEGPLSRTNVLLPLRLATDPAALPLALEALNDPHPRVMLEGARALLAVAYRQQAMAQAVDAIYARFRRDPYLDLVVLLAQADATKAWPAIEELSRAPDKNANQVAIRALAVGRDPRGIPWLKTVVTRGERGDAEQAVLVIGKIGGPAATTALADLLASLDDAERRALVLEGISLLPEGDRAVLREAVVQLVRAGKSTPEMDEALVRRGYLEPLRLLLEDPKGPAEAKVQALNAMANVGNETVLDSMAPGLTDPRPEVRRVAADAIGRIEAVEAIPFLAKATKDSDPEVRAIAARMLGQFYDDDELVEALTTLLRDPVEQVRRNAIDSLGRVGQPNEAMVAAYRAARNSSDPYVAQRAAHLLKYWQVTP